MGLAYQTLTAAVIFPPFWAILIVFGTTHDGGVGSQISQAKAESVLIGVLIGYYLPSITMVLYPTVSLIAIWQAFPVWMAAASTIYSLLRSKRAHQRSGYGTTQLVYIIIFIITTSARVYMLSSYGFNLWRVIEACIPTRTPPASPEATTLSMIVHFFQWDSMFFLGSSFLASLWFARNLTEAIGILAWCAVVTCTLGPGAALSTVLMWRESNLKSAREQVAALRAKSQ
jgi:hypothetical protein